MWTEQEVWRRGMVRRTHREGQWRRGWLGGDGSVSWAVEGMEGIQWVGGGGMNLDSISDPDIQYMHVYLHV
jgi:hypothetical protein